MTPSSSRFQRTPGIPFRYVDDDVIIAPSGSQTFESLQGTGADIWYLLDEPRTIAELAEALSGYYSGDGFRLRDDVKAFVDELTAQGWARAVDG